MGDTYKECDKCHKVCKVNQEMLKPIRIYDDVLLTAKFGMRDGCYSWIDLCPDCELLLVNLIREFEGKTLVQRQ